MDVRASAIGIIRRKFLFLSPVWAYSACMGRTVELGMASVFEARVTDVHTKYWMVDVYSDLTGRSWSDVQVGSPYLHYMQGDGVYAVPEVGALCKVCVPGDTSAPFVMTFVAPARIQGSGVTLSGDVDAATGTDPNPNYREGYPDMSANRPSLNPGDIALRRGDGNFVILRKGGVLQLGGSELAQRIYIPLGNVIMDFSEKYEHHNLGGSICWGMREGQVEQRESQWCQTFRVFADDKYADVRVVAGGVHKPVPLPVGDPDLSDAAAMQIGQAGPIVYEVSVVPGGFRAANGVLSSNSIQEGMTFLYRFDKAGNAHIKTNNLLMGLRGRFKMRAKGSIEFESEEGVKILGATGADLGSTGGTTLLRGDEVKIADGGRGAVRVGDPVAISLGPLAALLGPTAPKTLFGTVLTGSTKVKVG